MQERLEEMEKQKAEVSWALHPERMGAQTSADRRWKQKSDGEWFIFGSGQD